MDIWAITTVIRNQVAAMQAVAKKYLDFSIGSILLAVVESNSLVTTWLLSLILNVLAMTRASTSSGADLDSWMADYGVTRDPAVPSSGLLTVGRFTADQQAVIPVDGSALAETGDGTQRFMAMVDSGNEHYDPTTGGYIIPGGTASIIIPVTAITPGSGGNAASGAINVLVQSIPGVDYVSNPGTLVNGVDDETDDAFRARFVAFINSLAKATRGAVGYAVTSVRSGLTYTIVENEEYNGSPDNGYFYVVVDDGTGDPSEELVASIYNAIDAVRPIASRFGVFGPITVVANVTMAITVAAGFVAPDVKLAVKTVIEDYINALPLGYDMPYTKLIQVAYGAHPGVSNVSGVSLNGGNADLVITPLQVAKAGVVTIN